LRQTRLDRLTRSERLIGPAPSSCSVALQVMRNVTAGGRFGLGVRFGNLVESQLVTREAKSAGRGSAWGWIHTQPHNSLAGVARQTGTVAGRMLEAKVRSICSGTKAACRSGASPSASLSVSPSVSPSAFPIGAQVLLDRSSEWWVLRSHTVFLSMAQGRSTRAAVPRATRHVTTGVGPLPQKAQPGAAECGRKVKQCLPITMATKRKQEENARRDLKTKKVRHDVKTQCKNTMSISSQSVGVTHPRHGYHVIPSAATPCTLNIHPQ